MIIKNSSNIFLFVLVSTLLLSHKPYNPHEADFLEFWTDVKEHYAYFHKKHTNWNKVKIMYLPLAREAKNKEELIPVFEKALEELYDPHFSLNTNLRTSTRLVPTGLDLWAEYHNGKAIITEVRKGFSADKAGIVEGMDILSLNNVAIENAVNKRIGKCIEKIDNEVRNFALRQLLAGTYVENRILELRQNGQTIKIELDKAIGNLTDKQASSTLLDLKILAGNIGYIKINNSLGNNDLIKQFDTAVHSLAKTKAMIIDLRETPSGGNSSVARGIMSRFITREMPYQKHVLPFEEKENDVKRSWLELVSPRGPFTYNGKLVVLVNHWTGSMGEGLAIGFDALKRASIVGTGMAGLLGAINGFRTSTVQIPYSFPTEQLFHVNGTPREDFKPGVYVDLMNKKYLKIKDPVLVEALNLLK
jgi:C-terminal processing protease CtpA/Prc